MREMKKSTFVRKAAGGKAATARSVPIRVPGTRTSVLNGVLQLSSGLEDLDNILGGGVPLGSMVLIEEDEYSKYCHTLLRYYVAEGLAQPAHTTCLWTPEEFTAEEFCESLPKCSDDDRETEKKVEETPDLSALSVAWRYKTLVQKVEDKKRQSEETRSRAVGFQIYCHTFDLCKAATKSTTDQLCVQIGNDVHTVVNDVYKVLEADAKTVVRLCVPSLGSAEWGCGAFDRSGRWLLSTLQSLRGVLQRFPRRCSCVVSVPKMILLASDPYIRTDVESTADFVLDFDSYTGRGMDVSDYEFKQYSGVVHIIRIPVNVPVHERTYVFKMKRRKMIIELLHLPPEETREADNPNRVRYEGPSIHSQTSANTKKVETPLCGNTGTRPPTNDAIDF